MWPWGHLAVGYLWYAAGVRLTDRQASGLAVVALALGTQFPDLVDKPLAWTLAVLPNGRSLAHSLLVFGLVAVALAVLARRVDARGDRHDADGGTVAPDSTAGTVHYTAAFVLGYASHLFADAVHPLLRGNLADVAFLAWPLLPPVEYEGTRSFVAHFASMEPTPFFLVQAVLVAVALVAWAADGYPGIDLLRRRRRE